MDVAMRVDVANEATGEKLVAYCKKYFDEYLIVYEEKDGNNHFHVHGFTTVLMDTLRKAFRRTFPENSGNKGYEMKECEQDEQGYIRYLAKGDSPDDMPWLVDYKGNYDLDSLHEAYWKEFEERNGTFDANFKRSRKATTEQMLEEVAAALPDKWFDIKDKPRVLAKMFDVWQSHGKVLNLYRARDYYYDLAYKLAPSEDSKHLLLMSLTEKW